MTELCRYYGYWFEIASYKPPYIRDCETSSAYYYPICDTVLGVVNRCYNCKDCLVDKVKGTATLLSSCPYSFYVDFGFNKGEDPNKPNYIILDTDYVSYSIVGSNNGYFWILSRGRYMKKCLFDSLLRKAAKFGYNPANLKVKNSALLH